MSRLRYVWALLATHVAAEWTSDCASVDMGSTKSRSWPDGVHDHSADGAVDTVTVGGSFTQLSVEILTWQPFEQVTLRLPDDKPFQVRSAWSATMVAMDDEAVLPDEGWIESADSRPHDQPWWDTERVVRSVTFEIGCVPKRNEGDEDGHEETDDNGQAFVGEFGVILHTAPKNGVVVLGDPNEMPEGGGSYGQDGGEDDGQGGSSYGDDGAGDEIDLDSVLLKCLDPPMESDDEMNRERSQCDEELGGATMRLVNSWDESGGDEEMPGVKGFYAEIDVGRWQTGFDVHLIFAGSITQVPLLPQ